VFRDYSEKEKNKLRYADKILHIDTDGLVVTTHIYRNKDYDAIAIDCVFCEDCTNCTACTICNNCKRIDDFSYCRAEIG